MGNKCILVIGGMRIPRAIRAAAGEAKLAIEPCARRLADIHQPPRPNPAEVERN
jgi:hypothetical protein